MRNRMVLSALKVSFLFIVLLSANFAFSYPLVPDPDLTEGELCTRSDPDFSTYRYEEQIPYCRRNVSRSRRDDIYDDYDISTDCQHRFTIDHFIPLALGGDNSDTNLWPEHVLVKATRPHLERELYLALEAGTMTQDEAIDIIVAEKTKLVESSSISRFKDECDVPSSY